MRGGWGRRLLTVVALGSLASGVEAAAASTAHAASTGEVYIVNALQGESVDVLVDGETVGTGVAAKSIIGPLKLAGGARTLEVKNATGSLVRSGFDVADGKSQDVVVHRGTDAAGTPTVMTFPNKVTPIGRGKSRLVVTHVAAAPAADVRVDGKPVFRNVANGESLWLDVPAKKYSVDVVPTAGGDPILEPVSLTLDAGALTWVFAIGDVSKGTTDVIVQKLLLTVTGARAPTAVHTGDGGQAAALFRQGPVSPSTSLAVALAGLLLLAASRFGTGRPAEAGVGSRHAR